MIIDPSRIAHMFPILDKPEMQREPPESTTYNDFRRRLSRNVQNPELLKEQEMHVLYSYHYGQAINKIMMKHPGRLLQLSLVIFLSFFQFFSFTYVQFFRRCTAVQLD